MKKYFEFYNPVKIIAGFKALPNLSFELSLMESKKPLIITDKGVKKAGLLEKVLMSFADTSLTPIIIDDTPSDSSVKVVNEIGKLYKRENCDSIVAVGGGSVIDTAKGVNIVVSLNIESLKEVEGAEIINKKLRPLIVIPTTSGTGSEVTYVAVISDPENNVKLAFTSYYILPDVAIIDPEMTLTLPPELTATTSMDALTHAIEAYTSLQKNPISDSYSITSIKLINEYLIKTIKNGKSKDNRFNLALASLLAGISFSNSMVGIIHSISHALGGISHLPHGLANTIILPYGMEFNFDKCLNLYSELSLFFNVFAPEKTREENAKAFISKIFYLQKTLGELTGIPIKLSEAGVKKEDFDKIAEKAILDGSSVFNCKEFDREDVKVILEKAF